ncbi:MAG: chloride channel protein [Chloroflexota bacterium]|nr:chloride channel protein [Chloroflexota bacterium]
MTRAGLRLRARARLLRLRTRRREWRVSEVAWGLLLAVVVGLASGIGAVIFKWMIAWIHRGFFDGGGATLGFLGRYYVILLPALGGLLVGLLIHYLSREAKAYGVPLVMIAVNARSGRMNPLWAAVQTLASAICIGSGGSVGLHGPVVHIGAGIGSSLGQLFRLPGDWTKLLVACGAAGGIAATFNAPIAGMFFALELVLRRFSARNLILVGVSSVGASFVAREFFGDSPIFSHIPEYTWASGWEILFYIVLGIVAALVAVGFVRLLYKCESIFSNWRFPGYLKPAIGGLAVGVIGLFFPYVFGVGYEGTEFAILGGFSAATLLAMCLLKVLATSITLGSGGRGGTFAPSLFIGAMLGSAFGMGVNAMFPTVAPEAGAYGLVGMGAVFAAASYAPVTAILILFEVTRDYLIILPLIAAVVTSTFIARRISRDSIYTTKVRQRGFEILEGQLDPLRNVRVGSIMTRDFPAVAPDMPVNELLREIERTGHHGFPVLDEDGKLFGVVTLSDVEEALNSGSGDLKVSDIATRNPVTAYPEESVGSVLRRFATMDVGRIPVVSRDDPTRLLGCLRRHDIVRSYSKAVATRREDDL